MEFFNEDFKLTDDWDEYLRSPEEDQSSTGFTYEEPTEVDLTDNSQEEIETIDICSDSEGEDKEQEIIDISEDQDTDEEVICEVTLAVQNLIRQMKSDDKKRKQTLDDEQQPSMKKFKGSQQANTSFDSQS